MLRRSFNLAALAGASGLVPASADAAEQGSATRKRGGRSRPIRIAFSTDLSGPYQAVDGAGGVGAIRMAIQEAGPDVAGRAVELIVSDHRNDPARARALAQQWCGDEPVDAIISGVNSDTSLAITGVAAQRGVPTFVVGAGTSVQTLERSSPFVIQYAYDTVALATVPALALTRRGLDRWFFVTADYPFGRELETHATAAVRSAGGAVVGSVKNPHDADDFQPYLEQAKASGATVLGLANGHQELIKAMTALRTMRLENEMAVVGMLTFVNDIHEMGLEEAQGVHVADSWFWNRDTQSRSWSERFFADRKVMPSSLQAADNSAACQFLRAVVATGGTDPRRIVQHLKTTEFDDMYVHGGRIRDDGVMLHAMHLLRVKSPVTSSGPWDVYELEETLTGPEAFARRA